MSTNVENIPSEGADFEYKESFSFSRFARQNGTQLGILAVFIVLWIFFILLAPETFLQPNIY